MRSWEQGHLTGLSNSRSCGECEHIQCNGESSIPLLTLYFKKLALTDTKQIHVSSEAMTHVQCITPSTVNKIF